MTAIYLVRNDLRITDNLTLNAFSRHQSGIIIFIESKSLKKANQNRKSFHLSELQKFSYDLNTLGQCLYYSDLNIEDTLEKIAKSTKITDLYLTMEYAFDEKKEEQLITHFCQKHSIHFHLYEQNTLLHSSQLGFSLKNMPDIFTVFRKKVETQFNIEKIIPDVKKLPRSLKLEFKIITPLNKDDTGINRVHYYFNQSQKVLTYKETRNGLMNYDDSTKFSKWLNTGSLSTREIYYALKKFELENKSNESTYWVVFELLWRDYFKFLSLKHKEKIFIQSGLTSKNINAIDLISLNQWKSGKTGNSFIDANMRELNITGYMSNRGRQNVASFLIHDLKINWIKGAEYFEETLIDYDPDINYGNWLYLSGNGTDPRSRKFNIEKQAKDYDPEKKYRLKWLN